MRGVICALGAALLLAGCGGSGSTAARTTDGGGVLLKYERTGGIASMPSGQLAILAPGKAELGRGSPSGADSVAIAGVIEIDLLPGEFEMLQAEVDDADFASLPTPKPTGCADCYVYAISINGKKFSFDESNLPSQLQPLVDHLDRIVARFPN